MDPKTYNLDEGVQEYFKFIFQGHTYRFRYLTADEMEMFLTVGDDNKKLEEYLYKFITPDTEDTPPFVKVAKMMTSRHLKNFKDMVMAEMSP